MVVASTQLLVFTPVSSKVSIERERSTWSRSVAAKQS
jgi:hypothetical protein